MTDVDTAVLLDAVRAGDAEAREALFQRFYDELKVIARSHLRGRGDGTLGPTALVHESFLRLVGLELTCRDRLQLFALVSRAMRHVLIDGARRRQAKKRDGGERVTLRSGMAQGGLSVTEHDLYLLALDHALDRLAATDEELARVVSLRFFGGFTVEEIADAMELSLSSVNRRWRLARAWLHREIVGEEAS